MRSPLAVAVLLAAAVALAGCAASPPPAAELAAADFGDAPLAYRSEVREALGRKLFDPPSALLRFGEPFRAAVKDGRSGGGWVAGWVVPVAVKARRADGGYTGHMPRRFFYPAGGGLFELHDRQRVVPAPGGPGAEPGGSAGTPSPHPRDGLDPSGGGLCALRDRQEVIPARPATP